jgi:flagellar hook-associated protein 3 FlgL
MIHSLGILYDGLKSNNQDMIRASLDELEHQMDKTSSYQATIGSIYNALDSAATRIELGQGITQESVSNLEDADTFKAISDFKRTETVLQSTLMASNKLLQPSLLNFLQ